jgi:hypothetical protein
MALFSCTSCADMNYFIPEMLNGKLNGITIPKNFLKEYQKNFKIVIFRTIEGEIRKDYIEKVLFKNWNIIPIEK